MTINKEALKDELDIWGGVLARLVIILGVSMIVASVVKSCKREPNFNVTTSARDISPFLISDTTKPKPQPKLINHYTLSGNDTLFNLLYLQIVSPGDVTPNQKTKLQNWLQLNLKQDTTISK